ncbi:expressed unknown protein [Seminavis robusta]|uniref:Uncharacterized protein n=1 Tax=Seminavis robusta TaxID=568900 RepID=A0A9N8HHA1_9STRA|nr:expressed unknown protein [Seminavis robusta]|eukprot:Sro526_g160300.1 n/a (323) ;mRNA; r:9889-10953
MSDKFQLEPTDEGIDCRIEMMWKLDAHGNKRRPDRLLLLGSLICNSLAFTSPTASNLRTLTHQSTILRHTKWQPVAPSPIHQSPYNPVAQRTSTPVTRQSPLFGQLRKDGGKEASSVSALTAVWRRLIAWFQVLPRSIRHSKPAKSIQRAVVVLMASAMIWLGTAGSYTPPASAAAPAIVERILPASQEQIVDRYIRQHMFDADDMQDPLESAYREAAADYKTDGSYPRALKEVAADVLGKGSVSVGKRADDGGVFLNALQSVARFMERRVGVSESTALAIVAGSLVIATPITGMMVAMMIGTQSKRSMNRLMKSRYGESYT